MTRPLGEGPHQPTERQLEVLRSLFREGSLKDVAVALGISTQTAKQHVHDLYVRLGVESSREAAYRLWLRDLWQEDPR
jgi:DNA-binding NarL/FixJ family response regulator